MEKLELKHAKLYLDTDCKFEFNITDIHPSSPKEIRVQTVRCGNMDLLLNHGKLHLRPLSDLTKEIEHNGEKFVTSELITSIEYPIDYFEDNEILAEYLESWENSKDKSHHINFIPYGLITQLIEWHFDVFNLIEKGIAIDINTL